MSDRVAMAAGMDGALLIGAPRLKARFSVYVGVIPGQPMPEHTKVWSYTDKHFEEDKAMPPPPEGHVIDPMGPLDQPHITHFTRMHMESMQYYSSMVQPNGFNWGALSWMWV